MTEQQQTEKLAEGVAKGVEQGIRASRWNVRNWVNDRRLLVIYLVGVLILAVAVTFATSYARSLHNAQEDSQKAVKANCEAQNKSALGFNTFIDQAIANANNTTGLTPEQKATAIAKYAPLHQAILDCTHLAGP